jgi:hypothetical protein
MRGQSSVISIVIIAGMVVALIGIAYAWAIPMIEKRTAIADYNMVESFMLELDENIVDIANTGSGDVLMEIPKGTLTVNGYNVTGDVNNTITLDFYVEQPLITSGGTIPIKTNSLDYIGEYGKTEPRVLILSGSDAGDRTHLRMDMRYRELRSGAPNGYVIALCPSTALDGCDDSISGGKKIRVYYHRSVTEQRDQLEGGDLKITCIGTEVY